MASLPRASSVVKKVRSSMTTLAMVTKSSVKVHLSRNLSTSMPVRVAGDGAPGGGFQFWKKAFFIGAVPVIILGNINAFLLADEDAHARPDLVKPVLLGMGNPLLDISATVNPELLRKHNLKPNDAILTMDEAIFEDMKIYAVTELDFIPGGATQNSIRVAQWILAQKNATAYFGCVGSDATSQTLAEKAREAGVNVQYQINTKYPTGRCAVLITGQHRSLVTKLDAAEHYNVSHLEEADNWKTVEAANVIYSAGFFLTVSVDSMIKVAQHCAENDKTYCLNLSAPFLIALPQMKTMLPYADIVFGNETEAAEYAAVYCPEVKNLQEIAKKIAMHPKENDSKGRLVVITQGSGPVIVVENGEVLKFPVSPLPKNKIVDTNGAGDAFVGGFLAQYVQDKPLETAVRCGIWAATQIIQRSGCTYDEPCTYDETCDYAGAIF